MHLEQPAHLYTGIVARKASFSSSETCGPSGLLGVELRNLRMLPQPSVLRVSAPVTELVPLAYLQRACRQGEVPK